MRIGYFADGKWGQNAFLMLEAMADVEIVFVCLRFDTPDAVLKKMAEDQGIDVLVHPNVNADDFFQQIAPYHMDLLVSMSFNQIFKSRLLDYPRYHAINCHAGKLPFYRGRNILICDKVPIRFPNAIEGIHKKRRKVAVCIGR